MKKTELGSLIRLQHIRDAILLALDFVEGYGKDDFLSDPKTQAAVIRQTEIIGEATYHLPKTLTSLYPHIPWRNIAATRHKIVHEYYEIDLNVIWTIVQIHLPAFLDQIKIIISSLEKKEE